MFRILVVEDDRNLQQLMKAFLEKASYEVNCASDGVHALDMLEQKQYDLVVTDLMMPEMDGYELSKQIKKHTQIPIIMVTAKEELVDI